MKVCVFCGGRGSSALIRGLIEAGTGLTLLINGYDDGLSTGRIRETLPGMLGPSDFRKNISTVLSAKRAGASGFASLLEHRLPATYALSDLRAACSTLSANNSSEIFGPKCPDLTLTRQELNLLRMGFLALEQYLVRSGVSFDFGDCAVGNLLFAGMYLHAGRDFNRALREIILVLDLKAKVLNVSRGENRVLVALKANGELLKRESEIVSAQSRSPIIGLFLLADYLSATELSRFEALPLTERGAYLRSRECPVELGHEAREAILESDLIIFGPGTQHSSLYPSYKTLGLRDAIQENRTATKAMVVNIHQDHDIRSLDAPAIVDGFFTHFGFPAEVIAPGLLTHILVNDGSAASASTQDSQSVAMERFAQRSTYRDAAVVRENFETTGNPGCHNGSLLTERLLQACKKRRSRKTRKSVARGSWKICAIVPAAGKGTRLGLAIPKILAPVAPGETVLDLLSRKLALIPELSQIHLVLSPSGKTIFDQHGWKEKRTRPAKNLITVPLIRQENPYVEYIVSDSGVLENVKQRREGDSCSNGGLSDVGVFLLSTMNLIEAYQSFLATEEHVGKITGEINFLPFLAFLSSKLGHVFQWIEASDHEEARGINSPEDLEHFRRIHLMKKAG